MIISEDVMNVIGITADLVTGAPPGQSRILALIFVVPADDRVEPAKSATDFAWATCGLPAGEAVSLAASAAPTACKPPARVAQGSALVASLAVMSTRQAGAPTGAQDLIAAKEMHPDHNFERLVEQCLRHLSDYSWLGQSELSAELLIEATNHIERGKCVREVLLGAVESLRPAGPPPTGASCVPREWHSYIVLHDAYVEDVPNNEIMARLFISEGTFSRRRREALRAVAGTLMAAKRTAIAALQNRPPQARRLSPLAAGRGLLAGWPTGQRGIC